VHCVRKPCLRVRVRVRACERAGTSAEPDGFNERLLDLGRQLVRLGAGRELGGQG
jgi:hypothetical protein